MRSYFSHAGHLVAVFALAFLMPVAARAGIVVNQIDTFQDGTLDNWSNGGGAADPTNVATNGPTGSGDHFLQMAANGTNSAGGRLSVFNQGHQWNGNYLTAGVSFIEMDLKNLSGSTLSMRIALKSNTGKTGPGVVNTTAFSLAADGQWHHAVFQLDAAHLTSVNDTQSNILANVVDFRINETTSTSLIGDIISATVGVDNIHAGASVPEPTSLMLVGTLAVGGWIVRQRRRKVAAAMA